MPLVARGQPCGICENGRAGTLSSRCDGTMSATASGTKPLLANLIGIFDDSRGFRMISTDAGTVVGWAFTAKGHRDGKGD
jgi:hypothetical protein